MADRIIRDCTQKEQSPAEIIAEKRFARRWTLEQAAINLKNEERYAIISQIAQDDSLDLQRPNHYEFQEWFGFAEGLEEQYSVSPGYPLAVHYLKRLYIAREALPRITRMPDIEGIHTHEFGIVLRRLIEEL